MKKEEIKKFIDRYDRKDWYYYYNFDGIEVRPELKNTKNCGINNWNKIKNIIIENSVNRSRILDIGCNMGLYEFEMYKLGFEVVGVDLDISHALFFQKYVLENMQEKFDCQFIQCDVTKKSIPIIGEFDLICMFCVLYHLIPYEDFVIQNLPKHKRIIIQCNLDRVKSKKRGKQTLASIEGVEEFLRKHKYETSVFDIKGYSKPVVIGRKFDVD